MKDQIVLEATYPFSAEQVWEALTDPAALSEWLMPGTIEPKIGFRYQLSDGPMKVQGRVLEADATKLLRYTWEDGESGAPGVVTWTLTPTDRGTRVRLEHSALPVVSSIEATANWSYKIHGSLPGSLRRAYPPIPVVYLSDESPESRLRRAGFRQEPPKVEEAVQC